MCGFFAIIYKDKNPRIGEVLTEAGKRLSYRGYDTSGIVVINDTTVDLRKDVGKIECVAKKLNFHDTVGERGIIQLRWATFGPPTKNNAQPHLDCTGKIVGAHNGNIINSPQLRKKLTASGHYFHGINDGEIIPHLIEEHARCASDLAQAIIDTTSILEGDYAFVASSVDEQKMYAVKKGSSLFVGIGEGFICVSSDLTAVLDHTNILLPIEDGEFLEFNHSSYTLRDLSTGERIRRLPKKTKLKPEQADKGEYPHFMIKEIHEIPSRLKSLGNIFWENPVYREAGELISSARKIFITGAGTSYHSLLLGTYFMSNIANISLLPSFASDFQSLHAPLCTKDDILIAVSQSGETKDVKNACEAFRANNGGKIISILNNLNSTLAEKSDIILPIASDLEISVPATKTFTNQCLLFLLLAKQCANKSIDIDGLKDAVEETISLSHRIAPSVLRPIKHRKEFYILGFGITYPVALEAALKIKEVSYLHCEGMHSGEFKHGPLSIVEDGYPVFIISAKEDKNYTLSHIHEVKTRLGKVITIAPEDKHLKASSDVFVPIPCEDRYLFPIVASVFFQILAYKLAVDLGIDPDYPRNISKTITVD